MTVILYALLTIALIIVLSGDSVDPGEEFIALVFCGTVALLPLLGARVALRWSGLGRRAVMAMVRRRNARWIVLRAIRPLPFGWIVAGVTVMWATPVMGWLWNAVLIVALYLSLPFLSGLGRRMLQWPRGIIATATITAVVVLDLLLGSTSYVDDVVVGVLAFLVAVLVLKEPRRWILSGVRLSRGPAASLSVTATLRLTLVSVAVAWIALSQVEPWLDAQSPLLSPGEERRAVPDGDGGLAVALSGGGYRAALFHAGVLSGLDEMGVPVRALSTVSGGSIIGSFYAAGGRPEAFLEAVIQGRFNVRREMLYAQNLPFLLNPVHPFSRTHVQAGMLRRLFLDSLSGSTDVGPALLLNMTELRSGALYGITPHGAIFQEMSNPLDRWRFENVHVDSTWRVRMGDVEFDDELRLAATPSSPVDEQFLSKMVAASGAFPGALRAMVVETGGWGQRYFADGGIIDNTGLTMLYNAAYLARIEKYAERNLIAMTGDTLIWQGKTLDLELVRILSEFTMRYSAVAGGPAGWELGAWDVDLVLASDGSAVPAGGKPTTPLQELGMAIDALSRTAAGDILSNRRGSALGRRPPTIFLSPRLFGLRPADYVRGDFNWSFEPVGRAPVLGLTDLDSTTLARIVERITDRESRRRAEIAYAGLRRQGVIRRGRVTEPFLLSSSDHARVLYYSVREELYFALRAFAQTSTLRDQVPAADARAIFALGQYVAFINRSAVRNHLAEAVRRRAQHDTAEVQMNWTYVAPPWVCVETGDCSTRVRSNEAPHIVATPLPAEEGAH